MRTLVPLPGARSVSSFQTSQRWLPPTTVAVLCLGTLIGVTSLQSSRARADCAAVLPESIEVLPSDGAVVPSDIQGVFVYAGGFNLDLVLESDAARYSVEDRFAALPDGLKPGDVFEYTVLVSLDSDQKRFGPFSFTVGESPAPEVAPPKGILHYVGGGASPCAPEVSSPSCESDRPGDHLDFPVPRHKEQDCYDTGVASYYIVELTEPSAYPLVEIVWGRNASHFFSLGCSRYMDVGVCGEPNCVKAIPYDQAMRPLPELSSEICERSASAMPDAKMAKGTETAGQPMTGEPDAETDFSDREARTGQPAIETTDGGCAIGTARGSRLGVALLLSMLWVLVRRARARSSVA